jgi:hypothetical protein
MFGPSCPGWCLVKALPSRVTVMVVRLSCGANVAQTLLGVRCWGMLVTDRGCPSHGYPSW